MTNNSGFKKYLSNTSWLFAEKIFRIAIGLFITVWLARYLGPEQFGIFNYALSFVAIFGVLSSLGLDKLVTKELLSHPQDSHEIMGTSFTLRFIGAILLLPLAAFSISIVRPENDLVFIMVIIISSAFFFTSFEVIKYWFESHVQAKYSAIIDAIVIFTSSTIKGVLIILEAPLIAFAWVVLIESILLATGLIIIYIQKSNKISDWKVSFVKVKYLLKEAYPLILSGAVFVLFTRIDQVMLGSMIGDEAVGVYAAAVRISEGWMFIPAIIATSLFPAMLNARKNNYTLYLQRTQHLLNLMAVLGVSVAIGVIFIASPFMNLIFGESYSQSSSILIIHIWGMVFNAISIISFRYFLAEGLQIYSFYRAFAGLILNIALNYLLIPIYGAVGAAVATAISQGVAVWLLNSISPKTRIMFFMQAKALSLYWSLNTLKHIKSLRAGK
ncbi:flippase [Sulfurimonas sp. CVO]|uniref:flippase n=1 Tax=Sulfurimonas sp. CVO TaxID=2283483 RepID=UPI00135A8069|nr:flippase [Sulfurimonas sp. CVO]